METKKSKLSYAQKLAAVKKQLRAEVKEQEQVLDRDLSFFQQNIGSLVMGSVVDSVKDKIPSGLHSLLFPLLLSQTKRGNETTTSSQSLGTSPIKNTLFPLIAKFALPVLLKLGVRTFKKIILKK